jgi:WD40 repeat protein/tRNA A-37 threonylcarbamoyl transferase component Bud32
MFDIEPFDPLMPTKNQKFGDYELLEQIAQGGMGLVFKARQLSLNRIVALKVIRAGQLASPVDVQRFRIEAEAAAHLDHPRIVPIYEIGELHGIHYFSMKLVEGGNLAQFMDDYVKDHQAAARLLAAAARGIHYAHQRGVLHRDLKPANILVDRDGRPHVTDFGVAKRLGGECADGHSSVHSSSASGTLSGGIVGTPSYMAPEQAAGKRDQLTLAVDIYSLGAILYEMLTGRPPFKAATQMATLKMVLEERPIRPRALNPRVDRTLEAICMKCLEREPSDRYHSAEDLVNDLERWLANEPIEMQRGNAWVRTVKWAKRRPTTALMTALTVCIGFLALAGILWGQREAGAREQKLREAELARRAEQDRAEQTAAQLQLEKYADRLSEAQRLLHASNQQAARQHLAACPSKLRGWEWYLLDREAREEPRLLRTGLAGGVTHAAGAGAIVVFGTNQGKVAVADPALGRVLAAWQAHDSSITALAVDPAGQYLATSGTNGVVRVWDAATGAILLTLTGYSDAPMSLALNAQGQVAVALPSDGHEQLVRIHDIHAQRQPLELVVSGSVSQLAFSPNGSMLALGHADGRVNVWNLAAPSAPPAQVGPPRGEIVQLAFSPGSRRLAAAYGDGVIHAWPVGLGEGPETRIVCGQPVRSVAFSPDDTSLVAALGTDVAVWDIRTRRETARFALRGQEYKNAVFQAGGHWLAGLTAGGTVTLWPLTRQEFEVVAEGFEQGVTALATGKAERLAVLDGSGRATLWNTTTRRPVAELPWGPVRAVGCSPDGRLAFTLDGTGVVRRWDGLTGSEQGALQTSLKGAHALAVSPGGLVALAGAGGAVEVWDFDQHRRLAEIAGGQERIDRLAFSADGQRLAGGSNSGVIRLWEPRTGVEVLCLRGHTEAVLGLVFSPEGERLFSCSADHTVRFWNLKDGSEQEVLRGHTGAVRGLALSPDGARFVSASADRTLRVWDTASGTLLLTLDVGSNPSTVCFEADGKCLFTGGNDGMLLLWNGSP